MLTFGAKAYLVTRRIGKRGRLEGFWLSEEVKRDNHVVFIISTEKNTSWTGNFVVQIILAKIIKALPNAVKPSKQSDLNATTVQCVLSVECFHLFGPAKSECLKMVHGLRSQKAH